MFVELDGHVFLEVLCVFAAGLVDPVEHSDDDVKTFSRFGFFDVVFGCLDGFQRDSFAGSGQVGKDSMLDRVVLGAVGWIVANSNFCKQKLC